MMDMVAFVIRTEIRLFIALKYLSISAEIRLYLYFIKGMIGVRTVSDNIFVL